MSVRSSRNKWLKKVIINVIQVKDEHERRR
jgi:hypothetical protein